MNKELTIKIGTKKFTYDMLKKECLAIQMIPVAGNEERLASMPHTRFFDIAATYHFVITLGGAKFDLRITNELLDAFGVSAKQLQEDAVENAPKRFPMQIHSVAEAIEAMPEEMNATPEEIEASGKEMHFVTTSTFYKGAGCLFYPEFAKEVVRRLGGSFYILPSSIHELIVVKATGDDSEGDAEGLKAIVEECNADPNAIDPDEFLSDSVYYYDAKMQRFEKVQ